MKYIMMIMIVLFIAGCGGDKENQESGADVKDAKPDADQKLVNFQCTIADVVQYHFFENKIKIENPGSEGWLIDDEYYVRMEIGDKEYLVTGTTDDPGISVKDMLDMYHSSKTVPNFDCTLGGVTENLVTLPDLEIITNEELGQMMMDAMATGMN